MRKVLLFVAAMAMARAHAQNALLVENFDDAAGALLTTMGWTAHSGATTNPIAIVSPGLSWTQTAYPGSGVGNAAGVVNTGQDLNKPLSSNVTSGAVYTSFLVKAGAPVTGSQYFFHYVEYGNITNPVYTTLNFNFRARTFISPGTDPNTQFKLGLMWGSGTLTGDTTANLTIGSTYLVVVKYEFIAGADNDEVSLWVFEDGDNIASLPATPTIGPLTGTTDLTAIQGIALRQGGSGQNAIVDGIITDTVFGFTPPTCTPVRVEILNDLFGSEISWTITETTTGVVHASGGPYPDIYPAPYNAASALYVDTVCLPDNGTYEFRIEDSYGDGMTDGDNMGWYQVDILCPFGNVRVATIDTTLVSPYDSTHYGPFHYGSITNPPMYDSTVFNINCPPPPCTPVRVEILNDLFGSEISWTITETTTGVVHASGGPYPDIYPAPYNAASALYVDTVCLPDNGTYEFRIQDSYGDGLTDGDNMGWYQVDILCPWGSNRVATIDTTLVSPYDSTHYGPFHYGSITNSPMYDSTVFGISCIQYSDVTLQVDMNQVSQSFLNATVGSNSNSWWPWAAMTDSNGDNIWEATLSLPVGYSLEYKFGTEDPNVLQEQLDPNAPCTNGNTQYTNRVLVVPSADTVLPVVCWSSCDACSIEVTFNVNMAWEVANNAISADGIHVAGDFQGWIPSATEMTDADNDGVYEVTVSIPANSSIEYKFINGNAWGLDEPVPTLCAVTGTTNRGATFTYADSAMAAVCFGKCTDCMVGLDESFDNISLFPNPTTGAFTLERSELSGNIVVTVIGLQGQLLLATEWAAGQSELNIDLSDLAAGVYMVRLTAEEGTRTLRVAVQR